MNSGNVQKIDMMAGQNQTNVGLLCLKNLIYQNDNTTRHHMS